MKDVRKKSIKVFLRDIRVRGASENIYIYIYIYICGENSRN